MGKKSELSPARRREVVLMVLRREEPISVLARRYGVSDTTLRRWRDDFLQAGQKAKGRGFAASRGAQQDQELHVGNLHVQVVDGHHIAKPLGDLLVGYTSHNIAPFFIRSLNHYSCGCATL